MSFVTKALLVIMVLISLTVGEVYKPPPGHHKGRK
ncbi:hypothetical protein TcasGA2_TC033013 [Tribolium castaneum]|uniref:Uncharacterized protein n=1 Tax=Tribolium castaneum TaxID=7070 RepID=A0A139WHS2_TRICA|nr:hypothetical protein TcasGA2_TC033013 [Tribolium castaneum]